MDGFSWPGGSVRDRIKKVKLKLPFQPQTNETGDTQSARRESHGIELYKAPNELPLNHSEQTQSWSSRPLTSRYMSCLPSNSASTPGVLVSPLPFPRCSYSVPINATTKTGHLFLFGGVVNGALRNDLYRISGIEYFSTLLETYGQVPSPRAGHASILYGNVLVVWGGRTEADGKDDGLYELTLSKHEWKRVQVTGARPSGRYGHAVSMWDTKFCIFGGQVEDKFFSDLWACPLSSQKSTVKWECLKATNKQPPPRSGHVMLTYQNQLYIFGGTNGDMFYNDIWSFDLRTRCWDELKSIGFVPSPRKGHAATLVNDTMYVFGGEDVNGAHWDVLYAFKFDTCRWFILHDMLHIPSGRIGHGMASAGERIFIVGGDMDDGIAGDNTDIANDPNCLYALDTSRIELDEPNEASDFRDADINISQRSYRLLRQLSTPAAERRRCHGASLPSLLPPEDQTITAPSTSSSTQVFEDLTPSLPAPPHEEGTLEVQLERHQAIEPPTYDESTHNSHDTGQRYSMAAGTIDGVLPPIIEHDQQIQCTLSAEEGDTVPVEDGSIAPSESQQLDQPELSSDLQTSVVNDNGSNDDQSPSPTGLFLQLPEFSPEFAWPDTWQTEDQSPTDESQHDFVVPQRSTSSPAAATMPEVPDIILELVEPDTAPMETNPSQETGDINLFVSLPAQIVTVVKIGEVAVSWGGFADIYEGEILDGRAVALKVIRQHPAGSRFYTRVARELSIWSRLSHKNVLPFLGISIEAKPRQLCFISPWMSSGHIRNYLVANPDANRRDLIRGIADGLSYLHGQMVAHGDLKGENVLVDDFGHARLADFGLSVILEETMPEGTNTSSFLGSLRWMAPERLRPDQFGISAHLTRNISSDVYAFGMTVYEVMSGKLPFEHLQGAAVVSEVLYNGRRPEHPGSGATAVGLSYGLWQYVLSCWQREPSRRPSMSDLNQAMALSKEEPMDYVALMTEYANYWGDGLRRRSFETTI